LPDETGQIGPAPAVVRQAEPGFGLGVVMNSVMMIMVMVMMVLRTGKGRAGKHHQQQGSGKNLFHGSNLARVGRRW
jgi:hypothetical protein